MYAAKAFVPHFKYHGEHQSLRWKFQETRGRFGKVLRCLHGRTHNPLAHILKIRRKNTISSKHEPSIKAEHFRKLFRAANFAKFCVAYMYLGAHIHVLICFDCLFLCISVSTFTSTPTFTSTSTSLHFSLSISLSIPISIFLSESTSTYVYIVCLLTQNIIPTGSLQ